MDYQKIVNLLDDTANLPSKFTTRNRVEVNDESKRKYDNSSIRFKASVIRSNLCDYSDAYILVKGTITVLNMVAVGAAIYNTNKRVIFKNCAPFTNRITKINNAQVEDAQDFNIVMSMYNLIEYSDAYLKTSGSLWQYYRDELALDTNDNFIHFPDKSNNSNSFKFKQQITVQTGNGGTNDVEIMAPLKYLSIFAEHLKCL